MLVKLSDKQTNKQTKKDIQKPFEPSGINSKILFAEGRLQQRIRSFDIWWTSWGQMWFMVNFQTVEKINFVIIAAI